MLSSYTQLIDSTHCLSICNCPDKISPLELFLSGLILCVLLDSSKVYTCNNLPKIKGGYRTGGKPGEIKITIIYLGSFPFEICNPRITFLVLQRSLFNYVPAIYNGGI